jgi:CHAT domain-containing protein
MTEGGETLGIPTGVSSTPNCPEKSIWSDVCAGRVDGEKAEQLLEHASGCEWCGPQLREATIILHGEPDEDEEEFIAGLRSSRETWQANLARRLQRESQTGPPTTRSLTRLRLRWWPVYIAAAASAGFVALLVYRSDHSIDTLLAQAYDHQRMTELRVPKGEPVALYSPQRGAVSAEHESPELLEVRLAAEKALQGDSTNAYWHQVLGRIDVIEVEPESALTELQLAEARRSSLPRIQFDLGTAYFELGTQTGDVSNYGYAAERFSRYLDSVNDHDPVALYDRALCWQKTGIHDLARKDLKAAIGLEPNAAWRRAMQDKLQSLDSDPLPKKQLKPGESPAASSDGYEDQMATALQSQLADPSPSAIADLRRIAELGRTHGDYWLRDWMAASKRRGSPQADQALSEAIRQNLAGDSARALQDSVAAQRAYRIAGNLPGVLRSQTEEIYAYRRMGQPEDCLQHLAHLPINFRRYVWLSDSLALERAACLFQVGQFDMAEDQAQLAWRMAASQHLPLLAMRARGFSADFLTSQGLAEEGWKVNSLGLQAGDSPNIPPMRRYQFLSDLTLDAAALGLSDTAVLLAGEAARTADQTKNLQIAAYAWELLGHDQLAAGRLTEAPRSFARADDILAHLGETQAAATYRADWVADRAKLQLASGHGDEALTAMDHALPAIDRTRSLLIEINYWASRAQIESGTGNASETLSSATRAVESADAALAKLSTREKRRAWQRNIEAAYMDLVDSLAENNRPADALCQWLWFRGAPDSANGVLRPSTAADQFQASLGLHIPSDVEILVYARLERHYVVFAIDSAQGGIIIHELKADPNNLDQMIRTFAVLCADPGSRLAEVQSLGRELYTTLLSPALHGNPSEIRIDASGALEQLPFAALVCPSGNYLGSAARIVYLPEWWGMRSVPRPGSGIGSGHLLLVDGTTARATTQAIPAEYDESSQIARMFHHSVTIPPSAAALDQVLLDLPSAGVFHFAGHAVTDAGSTHLLLFSPQQQPPVVLTPDSLTALALPKCRLAFLAGCSTLGESPGRIGEPFALPSAFLRAGASAVIATRWNVDSESSRLLALAFYRDFLKGKSPSLALQMAQGDIRNEPRFQHPYYWSAFSLFEQ